MIPRPPRSTLLPFTTLFRSLTTIEQELRRALQHGFTASELQVQLADTEGALEAAAERANTRTNAALAQAIVGIIERSEENTPELQSRQYLVCRLLLEKKNLS